MATTNLNISIVEKRMLQQGEAAHYAGIAVKHFKTLCPVAPLEYVGGHLRWDKKDLDSWIDRIKTDQIDEGHESILRQLT